MPRWLLVAAGAALLSSACGSAGGEPESRPASNTAPVPELELELDRGLYVEDPVEEVPGTGPTDPPDASNGASAHDAGAFDVTVSATISGGPFGPVAILDVEVDHDANPTEPWITFDLRLDHRTADPNSIVFSAHRRGGASSAVRVEGPACVDGVICEGGDRRVELALGAGPPLVFSVYRNKPLTEAGTSTVDIDLLYDYDHPGVPDEPVVVSVRFDAREPVAGRNSDSSPLTTPFREVSTVGGGFDLLQQPSTAFADDPEQLATILASSERPVAVADLDVDWEQQAVVVFAISTNSCVPLLEGLGVSGGVAYPRFVDPDYQMCDDFNATHTVIAAVDRALLLDVDRIASQGVGGVSIDVTPPGSPLPTTPVEVDFGEVRGTAELPARGQTTTATLDDGTPIFVVHHDDGAISALDPRAATDHPGLYQVVGWVAGARQFRGVGAWDEYGRRLDGFRASDLHGFAARVAGDRVEIGAPVGAPEGTPVVESEDPAGASDVAITPADALDVDEAMALPVGRTAWVDADVIVDPGGAHICVGAGDPFPIEPCPVGSPAATEIAPLPGARTVWVGPTLASRSADGFERVAPTAGVASVAL